MKKITLLSIVAFLFTSVLNAQISKGSLYLGGSISGSTLKDERSTSPDEGKIKTLVINPQVGVAFKKNLIAGVNLYYLNGSSKKFTSYNDFERKGYGAGVFVRNYFPISTRFLLFTQSDLNYNQQKIDYPTNFYNAYPSKEKDQTVALNFYPGLTVNVFKSLYLEAGFSNLLSLGYTKSTNTSNSNGPTSTETQKGFFFQTSLTNSSSLTIGMRFIIPKK